jgi:hypothetical protein
MPLLSLLVFQFIIPFLILHPHAPWHRTPPPAPASVIFHHGFQHEWNKGLHGYVRRYQRFKYGCSFQSNLPDHALATINKPKHGPPCLPPIAIVPDVTTHNGRLLALLFSLSTTGLDTVYHFDPTMERICVDTGVSACISTQKGNFIHLHPVNNLKINGSSNGLPI